MNDISNIRVDVVVNAKGGIDDSTGRAGSPAASRTTAQFILACGMQLLTIFLMLARALIH